MSSPHLDRRWCLGLNSELLSTRLCPSRQRHPHIHDYPTPHLPNEKLLSNIMHRQYLTSLTKHHDNNNTTLQSQNVAYTNLGLKSTPKDSMSASNTYTSTQNNIGVEDPQHAALMDTATPPGIAQGCRLLYPGTTTRIPDYEKMRNMCPDEWVRELRNPSLVLAAPKTFAMPLPARSKEVNREKISAIVDQDWEYREGKVELVSTKQFTIVKGHSVSDYIYIFVICFVLTSDGRVPLDQC